MRIPLYILVLILINFGNTYKLADVNTMRKQLSSIGNEKFLLEGYFPLLLKHAETHKTPMGVVMMFSVANYEFSESMLKTTPFDTRFIIQTKINLVVPNFILAIMADNLDEAQETINLWNNRKYLSLYNEILD